MSKIEITFDSRAGGTTTSIEIPETIEAFIKALTKLLEKVTEKTI